jgi:hypothetical protein
LKLLLGLAPYELEADVNTTSEEHINNAVANVTVFLIIV